MPTIGCGISQYMTSAPTPATAIYAEGGGAGAFEGDIADMESAANLTRDDDLEMTGFEGGE
jgi:hypothetical protein